MNKIKQEILHYPNLKTVLMVEDTLKKSNEMLNREELKAKLPVKIMHQTLNVILQYLEKSGKIIDGRKGILWIYKEDISEKLKMKLEKGVTVT